MRKYTMKSNDEVILEGDSFDTLEEIIQLALEVYDGIRSDDEPLEAYVDGYCIWRDGDDPMPLTLIAYPDGETTEEEVIESYSYGKRAS